VAFLVEFTAVGAGDTLVVLEIEERQRVRTGNAGITA
jgi:hypothetical protein